jgi:hypothetical protein
MNLKPCQINRLHLSSTHNQIRQYELW